ncbi:hypothetical protein [Anaerosporobacter sp.]|uniref:hypothetical protein n=1 Tax=Anaerosporobacter sp. TaxID=1872529 RepID=UPI00286F2FA0|nr:hypothetical protein [Anaerosporobacter sp.]
MDEKAMKNRLNYGKLVSKCWDDDELKKRLIESPRDVLAEFGLPVEWGVTYKVIEAPRMVQYIVLPHENATNVIQEVSKSLLQRAEDNPESILPGELELRFIQDTKEIRHIVLPFPIELMTIREAATLGIRLGDSTATVKDVVTTLYAVSQVTVGDIVGVATEAVAGVFVAAGAVIVLI